MARRATIALSILGGLAVGAASTSCSSEEDGPSLVDTADAAPEAEAPSEAGPTVDAGDADAPTRDAAPFDGGPLPISCTSKPCVTSLVTTRPAVEYYFHEGYCALLDDGTVACWGSNEFGQLGRGDAAGPGDSATAMRVEGLSDVVQLDHTCAVDRDGGVWCWGTGAFLRNDSGASTTERTASKLALPPAKRVATALDATCAVIDDGSVLCWGRNTNGLIAPLEVSAANATLPPTPVAIPPGAPIRDLVLGKAAFAIREDGVTLSWGASPPLGRVSSMAPDSNPMAIPVAGLAALDTSTDNACAAASGTGYCWGRAVTGLTVFDRIVPEPIVTPEPVVQIATTQAFGRTVLGTVIRQPQRWCAVGASGAVYCWGFNGGGQAGDGTKDHAYEAVEVKGLPAPAVEVKTLPDSTCALLTTGKVFCWGTNYYGQLGNGKIRTPSLVPQEVVLP